jgi:LytS/YehU family sensor histidine kinase
MFLLSLGDIYAEYCIYKCYDIPFGQYSFFSPGRNWFIDLFSNFFIFTLYLTSISVVAFYKNWIDNTEKVERLKTEQLHSELDNLKSRISTEFLSNKLHQAAKLCRTHPSKSSQILLQLSRVLRYQLYDCSRENVLLSSEIKFLNDYLDLEKTCNNNLDFKIITPETLPNCLIPPLLLLSIVEKSLKHLSGREDSIWINLEFSFVGKRLIFTCKDNREIIEMTERVEDYLTLYKRLELLQSYKYELNTLSDKVQNQYKVIFQYEI